MPQPPAASHPIRLAAPGARRIHPFTLAPDAAARAALAADLGITAIGKLGFEGALTPEGRRDWRLEARLTATVVQPCVVTLDPVTTKIRETVTRRYMADWQEPRGDEVEMPGDDTAEALPDAVDPALVMAEALALALPAYPRASAAGEGQAAFAAPEDAPSADGLRRPFAGLADLLGARPDGGDGGDRETDGETGGGTGDKTPKGRRRP